MRCGTGDDVGEGVWRGRGKGRGYLFHYSLCQFRKDLQLVAEQRERG